MIRFLSRQRATLVGFIVLVLPLVSLWYHGKQHMESTPYQRALIRLTSPAQDVISRVIGAVRMVWSDYVWLVGVQQENRELRRVNGELLARVQDRTALRKENERLKRYLQYKGERPDLETIAARVVAKDVSPYHRVLKIRIAAGSEHGVQRFQPVVTPGGVVGYIEKRAGRSAEVKLSVAAGARISVDVADREVKGIVVGSGDRNTYSASFETSDLRRAIHPGDLLLTNGEDERFPKGLVVGYVSRKEPVPDGTGLRYEIEPAVPFGSLEEVFVVVNELERPPRLEAPR